jgi:hypothetical protein
MLIQNLMHKPRAPEFTSRFLVKFVLLHL